MPMLAVTIVLLFTVVGARLGKWLGRAAEGDLNPGAIALMLGLYIPSFLEMIIPLAFFLGILLAYGRMYVDNEMTVLFACGFTLKKLILYTLVPGVVVTALVASLTLYLSPIGRNKADVVWGEQAAMTAFDTVGAGRFVKIGGNRVFYINEMSPKREMIDIFVAETNQSKDGKVTITTTMAKKGFQHFDKASSERFLMFEDAVQHESLPGELFSREVTSDSYAIKFKEQIKINSKNSIDGRLTQELYQSTQLNEIAEFQWRVALPLTIPILILLGVPMSRVSPRQGRFLKVLPALMLYLCYMAAFTAARNALEKGKIPPEVGLWSVHVLFLLIALGIIGYTPFKQHLKQKKLNQVQS